MDFFYFLFFFLEPDFFPPEALAVFFAAVCFCGAGDYNFPPRKLYYYACLAFSGELSASYILEKLKLFLNRFFAGQFKRSCTPDSARITDVNLTCWSIPSDASAQSLLCDLDEIR